MTVSGTLSAAGKRNGTTGGTILITGENIQVSGATIDASGQAGGGTVLIGGDWGGGHPNTGLAAGNASAVLQPYAVPNANTVSIDAATMIDASATNAGNGGKVIVWANQATTFLGTILAKGGVQSGNGGFVETSGGTLSYNGAVNTCAANGNTGTWLIDPTDLTIDAAGALTISNGLVNNNVVVYTDANGNTSGQGTISSGPGDIIVASGLSWSSGHTLTLNAYNSINIDAAISGTIGGLTLIANNAITASAPVAVGTFTLQNGAWTQVASNLPAFSANDFVISGGSFLRASGGDGSSGNPYQIVDVYGLEGMSTSPGLLSNSYVLANSIDALGTANWNGGAGFVPIGNSNTPFTGTFNGNGNTISNLTINLPSSSYVGPFGEIASSGLVENVGVVGGSVTGDFEVGGLAGGVFGKVTNSYATDAVTGNSYVGGLVGGSSGTISQSYAASAVTGTSGSSLVGGLIGANGGGTVIQSYAIGSVTGGAGATSVGGLIGGNPGTVTSSYWDTQTTGQSTSAGGMPLTTAAFTSGLPSGFDATAWGRNGGINNGFPYLLWQLPSGSQVIAGYVFNDIGITSAGGGISVSGLINGTAIGTVTTGANGSYNIVVLPGTISGAGSQVLTYTTGVHAGAAYIQNATGSIENLNIYVGYLNEISGAANLSTISSGFAAAIGSNAGVQSLVNGLPNRAINATSASFAIDQSLSTGTLLLSSTGVVTQSEPITATNLLLTGSGGGFTLTNSANQVGTLAATTGSVSLTNATSLNIGTVDGTSGVTASGALTLDVSGGIGATSAINVGTFTLDNGNWTQLSASLPSFSANNFVIAGGSFLRAAGGDGKTSPYQITDVYGLQGIGSSTSLLAANYTLANSIDASGTANWNGGSGFAPIGNGTTSFTGTFNGDGNTISNLTINLPASSDVGLFGMVGVGGAIKNTGLISGSVIGDTFVGDLIGAGNGTVTNSYATGKVTASAVAGGLVGQNSGTISGPSWTTPPTSCSAGLTCASGLVTVGAAGQGGGLVGANSGTISFAFATGNVTTMASGGAGNTEMGGFVAKNTGQISYSFATGSVGAAGITLLQPGGFVAENAGTIDTSFASGAVLAGDDATAGGFVGHNDSGGAITNSQTSGAVTVGATSVAGGFAGSTDGSNNLTNLSASGAVSGGDGSTLGGLVGGNTATITASSATGNVTGGDASFVGGLVGLNTEGAITQSSAIGAVTAGDSSDVGGLVGYNFGGPISQSFAGGTVIAGADATAGGLVGLNSFADTNASASITNSHATGAVTAGDSGTAGGLVGYNLGASITQSYATGAVTVGANAFGGGLVGVNFNCCDANGNPISGASIANSYATGTVSSAGINVELGGLVGENDPLSVITNSQAAGAVVSTANLPANATNCSSSSNCLYVDVGGFVGANYGTISGAIWTTAPTTGCMTGGAFACAGGNVAVGQLGSGGGFAGYNEGIITYAFATGAVTGAAGLPDTIAGDVFDNTTQIAGFVAENQGQISHSFAMGNVGTAGMMWLSAAGFAGSNKGTIDSSFASGTVTAGDNSTAGGFVSDNSPGSGSQTPSCVDCFTGDGFNNSAAITNAQASGGVTVGASSVAGGFAAIGGGNHGQSGGSFTNVSAAGAVNVADNSIVGGLVGVLSEGGTLANSKAQNTLVASSGANSVVGGIVGVNEGSISDTTSTAPVSGTSDSYIGGVTGINLGSITGSSSDPDISGSGGDNFVGGIAGLNVGTIDNSTGLVALSSGSPNYAGGAAGVNAAYGNSAGTIPNSSFPIGTITNSSATGSGFTDQVGTTSPSFIPGLPAWLAGCTDAACTTLTGGSVQLGTTPVNNPSSPGSPNTVPTDTAFANQQVLTFTQQASLTPANIAPPLVDPATVNTASAGPNGNPGNGPGNNGVNGNNGNSGTLANGRQGGNGAPPGMRLVDMRVMPLPPGTGLPPPGETRFLPTQVVMQFGAGMTPQQVAALAQRFGLTVVAQQTIGAFGRTVYTFQINNGRSVAAVIQAIDNAELNAAAQPNYTYGLSQDRPGSAADLGDPAQYVVSKLQLGAVHRITQGKDVVVAVIDSRVDTKQPDFAGRIVDYYDAGCGPDTPPDAHGTGMAGAIASHIGLLGVAPNARIIAICAFGGTGKPEATSAKIIRGVDYAIAHGAKIINMSFAGPRDPALAQELQIAREKGILIIAAAGNAGPKSPPLYPGADPNVMAVTATDEHDRLFAGANQGNYVTVAAPGVNILVPAPSGDVQFTTGTSVASANVSGVAALLLAEKPTRTPEEIRAILVDTAKHLGPKGVNAQFGAGLVDPLKALRFVPPAIRPDSSSATSLRLH